MMDETLISRVQQLSTRERLELMGILWDSLSAADVPVTEADRKMLDARIADAEENPEDQAPWSEVRERLRNKLP